MSEWSITKLGDVLEITNGYAFKSVNFRSEPEAGCLPVLKIKNVANGDVHINDVQYHHFEEKLSKYTAQKGDILISLTGNHPHAETQVVGAVSKLKMDIRAFVNQRVAKIDIKPNLADKDYIYFALKEEGLSKYLASQSSGSANQANISKADIEDLDIALPPLPEQKTIASVLSSLDDKIDLLHRQNKTLEAMAETLFRQWFIEEAKEEWEEVSLADVVESANTGLDAIRRAPIVEDNTGIKCLRIQDISQCKPFHLWGNSQVLEKDFKKAQLKYGDLIMARTCSPGIVYLCREDLPAVFNNGLAKIRPNLSKTYSLFLYYLFKSEEFIGHIYGISDGTSVQLNMKLGDLLSYKLRFPSKTRQDEIYPIFHSLNEKQFYNSKQIQTLENLRNTLLPKLMSGEVRVQYQTEDVA